jgi:hypothetical protein
MVRELSRTGYGKISACYLSQREDQGLENCRVWDFESKVNVTERGRGLSDMNAILNQREIEILNK